MNIVRLWPKNSRPQGLVPLMTRMRRKRTDMEMIRNQRRKRRKENLPSVMMKMPMTSWVTNRMIIPTR